MTFDPLYNFVVDTYGHSPIPDRVRRLLEIVDRDLRPPGGLSVVYDAEGRLWVWERGAHSGGAWRLDDAESEARNVTALADWLQRQLYSASGGLATSDPQCGEHPHSMIAKLVDGEAWWCCRDTGEPPIRRIGELSELDSEPG